VPRKNSVDDEAPRRRRGAKATAADEELGPVMRIFLRSPKDAIAGALAFATIIAIIANALFLQTGRHPAPMFTAMPSAPANPLPRPRPTEADASETRLAESRAADLMANLLKTTSTVPMMPAAAPRPPVAVPVATNGDAVSAANTRRVAAVQRALTDYGYGQLKPTGIIGSDTQAAIQKFERARKLPVTGQVSDRLLRELTATIGHPID
jgi:Putative peptidoglycan binding domain